MTARRKWRSRSFLRSFGSSAVGERAHGANERVTAVLVVAKHVEARAGGAEEDAVASFGQRSRDANRFVHRGSADGRNHALHGVGDPIAGLADEHQRPSLL